MLARRGHVKASCFHTVLPICYSNTHPFSLCRGKEHNIKPKSFVTTVCLLRQLLRLFRIFKFWIVLSEFSNFIGVIKLARRNDSYVRDVYLTSSLTFQGCPCNPGLAAVETYVNQNSLSLEALGKKFQKRLTVFPGKRCALPSSLAKARILLRFAAAALAP
jgi:hypothetical protein